MTTTPGSGRPVARAGMGKIGVHAGDLNIRIDGLELLRQLCDHYELVLFRSSDEPIHGLDPRVEQRKIAINTGFLSRAARRLYRLFGAVPKRDDYYSNASRRALLQRGRFKRRSRLIALVRRYSPLTMSTELFLRLLSSADRSELSDINQLLFLTHIESLPFFARAYQSNLPICVYLSSWDHVCKDIRYPRQRIKYLVWNEGCKEDLHAFHRVPEDCIRVVGSTQFTFLHRYLNRRNGNDKPNRKRDRVYFVCAHGYPGFVEQEVEIVRRLFQALQAVDLGLQLCVRPYPNLKSWEIYERLRDELGFELDNQFRDSEGKQFQTSAEIDRKYDLIEDSVALFHCGTTLGLEACFLKTPVFLIVPEGWDLGAPVGSRGHIETVFGLRHLQRYLVRREYPNVITEEPALEFAIKRAVECSQEMTQYNDACAEQFELRSMGQIVDLMLASCHAKEKVTHDATKARV